MIFPSRRLTFGLGLAAAAGVAVWSGFDQREPAESAQAESPGCPVRVRRLAEGPVKPTPLPPSPAAAPESPSSVVDLAAKATSVAEVTTIAAPLIEFQPTREELELRAFIVEQQANKQLKTLLGVLNLTEDQQDRIFSTLARRSDYYHPALRFQNAVGGELSAAPAATPVAPAPAVTSTAPPRATPEPATDPILAELQPEQVEVYERYRSERDSFWAGVVSDIEQKLNTNGR